jgi:hypothetical protein
MALELPPLAEIERETILALAVAYNCFRRLPIEHPDDEAEFRQAIHRCQALVASRPARRALRDEGSSGAGGLMA